MRNENNKEHKGEQENEELSKKTERNLGIELDAQKNANGENQSPSKSKNVKKRGHGNVPFTSEELQDPSLTPKLKQTKGSNQP